MAERITITNLRRLVERLNKMTNSPLSAWTKTSQGLKGNIGHYFIDKNIGGFQLEQVTGEGGSVRIVLERGTAKDLYYRIHAFMTGLDECPSTNYKNNPKTGKLQQRFNIDDWTAKKISELNNEIRRLVKNGRTVAEAKRKVKSESVAGPKIWKAVDLLLKEYPPVERNPRKKTAKRKSRSRFTHEDIRSPSKMAKGSIRTKTIRSKRGKVKAEVRIGCPKGQYNRRTGRCKVGTRAVSVLRPNPKPKTFRVFTQIKKSGKMRYAYLTPEKEFDTDYKRAELFYRETAIERAKSLHRRFPQYPFGVSDGKA